MAATMSAMAATMSAKDATMSAKDATMSAKDATRSAKAATKSTKDATMSGKDATIASMCGMAAPKPLPGGRNRGPGEMYGDPGGYPQGTDRVPAVCIFAGGVLYRGSQS